MQDSAPGEAFVHCWAQSALEASHLWTLKSYWAVVPTLEHKFCLKSSMQEFDIKSAKMLCVLWRLYDVVLSQFWVWALIDQKVKA